MLQRTIFQSLVLSPQIDPALLGKSPLQHVVNDLHSPAPVLRRTLSQTMSVLCFSHPRRGRVLYVHHDAHHIIPHICAGVIQGRLPPVM